MGVWVQETVLNVLVSDEMQGGVVYGKQGDEDGE
jgi:hypothetical protein